MMEVSPDNPEWVRSDEADVMLGVSKNSGMVLKQSKHIRQARIVGGKGRRPFAFHDDDVMAIAEIRRQVKCSPSLAIRIFDAMKEGRLPEAGSKYRETLEEIVRRAPMNGEDVCYLIAKQGLE